MNPDAVSYRGFRYPAEIISHCVWLYHRFPLSFREVQEMMLARGVVVSHETIRQWCAKFGAAYAAGLRRRRPRVGDKWHLDEVFIKVNGARQYLWQAVDQDGNVLDILVQSRRNAKAAKRFLAKLMKTQRRVPRVLVTDKLRSYAAAHRDLMSSVEHRQSNYLNNRAENSHQPTGCGIPSTSLTATTRQAGAERGNARIGFIEGCPRAAVWSGCARPTGCHTAPARSISESSPGRRTSRSNEKPGQSAACRTGPCRQKQGRVCQPKGSYARSEPNSPTVY